jgi:hypothetical protein
MPQQHMLPNQIIMWDRGQLTTDTEPALGGIARRQLCQATAKLSGRSRRSRARGYGRFWGLSLSLYRDDERWGALASLSPPVSRERAFANPVLALRPRGRADRQAGLTLKRRHRYVLSPP